MLIGSLLYVLCTFVYVYICMSNTYHVCLCPFFLYKDDVYVTHSKDDVYVIHSSQLFYAANNVQIYVTMNNIPCNVGNTNEKHHLGMVYTSHVWGFRDDP